MQLQGEVFVLRHNFIDEADATEFYEQAQRNPSMKLTDCMQKQAIKLRNFRIMINLEFNIIDRRLRHDWQTKLSVLQVAKLIIKYFSPIGVGECTLAESFSQVPFHDQIANHDHENATFARHNELVSNYEMSEGPLWETQHAELIRIFEKRLAKGSQIQQDYLKAKAADDSPPHTWYSTMLRIGQVLAEARVMVNLIKSYGNPETVYSFSLSAVPPDVGKKETSRASAKAPSPTPSASSRSLTATVRTPSLYVPTQHELSVRASTEVPLVPNFRPFCSCGSKAHLLNECPVLCYSDANSDNQTDWESSTVGMAWAAVGYTEWQLNLILLGYE